MSDPARDSELGARFGRLPDVDTASAERSLAELAPRFARARHRRRQAVGGAVGVVSAVAVVVGVSLSGGGGRSEVRVAGEDGAGPTTIAASPSTVAPSTTPTTAPATVPTSVPAPTTTIPAPPSATAHPSTSSPRRPSSTVPSGPVPGPTTSAAPSTTRRTTVTTGGTVVVDVGATLTLISATPAAAFERRITHQDPDRIEVRFESATHESRVELRLEAGVVAPRTEERDR